MESILSLQEVNILILQKNIIVMMTVWIMQRPNISERIGIILTMTKIIMKQRMKSPASINGTVLLESMKRKQYQKRQSMNFWIRRNFTVLVMNCLTLWTVFLIFHTVIN